MTELLFREDPYAQSCEAQVVAINDRGGVVLDRTVFYATSGGQPGDSGTIARELRQDRHRHHGVWRHEIRHRPCPSAGPTPALSRRAGEAGARLAKAACLHAHPYGAASAVRAGAVSGDRRTDFTRWREIGFRYSRSRRGRPGHIEPRDQPADQGGSSGAGKLHQR